MNEKDTLSNIQRLCQNASKYLKKKYNNGDTLILKYRLNKIGLKRFNVIKCTNKKMVSDAQGRMNGTKRIINDVGEGNETAVSI